MIKPKQSLQRFQQKAQIQQQLAKIHGYSLQNLQFSPKSRSLQKKQQVIIINKNINPLIVKQKQVEKNVRLQELIKQIEQLHIQKKVNKMIEEKNAREINMTQLLNTKIKQYNFLIEHRHLIKKRPAKSLFQEPIKNADLEEEDGRIMRKLIAKQKQLNKTSSLISRINKNRQIASIYRDYSLSLKINRRQVNRSEFIHQSANRNSITSSIASSNTTNKKQYNPNIKAEIQIKEPQNKKKIQRYQQKIDVEYPYASKNYLQSASDLTDSLRQGKKLKNMMIDKLKKIQSPAVSSLLTSVNQENANHNISQELHSQLLSSQQVFNQQYEKIANNEPDEGQENQIKQKQKYLLLGLRKRSPKFIKAEDSKFVSHYKVQKIAKQMLKGPQFQPKKQLKLNIPRMYNRKLSVPKDISEQDKAVMNLMIEEEDDAYYWTTCRNEKMNLLLKGKIHK